MSVYWINVLSPTWSIAVEEQIYVIWSIAVRFLKVGTLIYTAMALIPIGIVLRCALLQWSQWGRVGYISEKERWLERRVQHLVTRASRGRKTEPAGTGML